MDRVFLTIICAGIVLLVTALALGTPRTNSGGLTNGLYQRVLRNEKSEPITDLR